MAKIICAGAYGKKNAGHGTLIQYDLNVAGEVKKAELAFNELMVDGAPLAFVVAPDEGGPKKATKRITAFDPTAQEIVVLFPMAGG